MKEKETKLNIPPKEEKEIRKAIDELEAMKLLKPERQREIKMFDSPNASSRYSGYLSLLRFFQSKGKSASIAFKKLSVIILIFLINDRFLFIIKALWTIPYRFFGIFRSAVINVNVYLGSKGYKGKVFFFYEPTFSIGMFFIKSFDIFFKIMDFRLKIENKLIQINNDRLHL